MKPTIISVSLIVLFVFLIMKFAFDATTLQSIFGSVVMVLGDLLLYYLRLPGRVGGFFEEDKNDE